LKGTILPVSIIQGVPRGNFSVGFTLLCVCVCVCVCARVRACV